MHSFKERGSVIASSWLPTSERELLDHTTKRRQMLPWFAIASIYARMHCRFFGSSRVPGLGFLLRRVKHDRILNVEGLKFYVSHRVATCYQRMVAGQFNETETHVFLRAVLRSTDPQVTVSMIDAGASIGEITMDMARHDNVHSVLSFEPQPICAQLCEASAALNHLDDVVSVRKTPLSNRSGEVRFEYDFKRPRASRIVPESHNAMSMRATTLDKETTDIHGAVIVKIDVEGAELAVMQGGANFIKRVEPLIVFEYLGQGQSGFSLDDVRSELGDSYQLYRLRSDGRLDQNFAQTWNCVAVPTRSPFWQPAEQLLAA